MKSCILFSISIESEEKLYVLQEYLQTFKTYFSDCRFYIGINYGSHPSIENIISSYNLNTKIERVVDKNFHVSSDASGYQKCLQMLKNDTEHYDICWFAHTKGGFNGRDEQRNLYLENFFPRRIQIENIFDKFPSLGVVGYRCGGYMWHNHQNNKCLQNQERFIRDIWGEESTELFKYTFCELIIIETMFAMNAEILYKFLEKYPEFLYNPLNTIPTAQWIIELELANIVPTRMGYFPLVLSKENWMNGGSLKNEIDSWIDNWIKKNNLHDLNHYKELL